MTKFSELAAAVETARLALLAAEKSESEAQSKACDALNLYNVATKALDAEMATIRKDAPRGTDWADRSRQ